MKETPAAIKWTAHFYPGIDAGATYAIEGEYQGFLLFTDEWGRPQAVHARNIGVVFEIADKENK